ncbi:MAG: hypothetical protein U1D30_06885 [Planctomycetota bacterium]
MATNVKHLNSDAAILSRLLEAEQPALTPDAAKSILALQFQESDRQRMNLLAEKAREGALSEEERDELDNYERVGHLLSLMKSKARRSLDSSIES